MPDFLLELRSEEIPARMQARARDDLARLFAAELARAGLPSPACVTYATPRRLALIARGLPELTPAAREETKGPRASAPPQALDGFLRKTGLAREALVERDGVLFAVVERPGRPVIDVLAEAIPTIVRGFPWPKSMRWGAASASPESLRWVRPLQGIVALLGEEIVPCEVAGVVSGAATVGHRFHHPGAITVGSADDYSAKLRACHVIVDPDERAAIIRARAEALAAEAGLELVPDEGLVAENAGLTEWPVPLLGRFDPAFLAVPPEVIQLTARVNQKYFVCRDANGALADAFVLTANIDAADGGAAIVEGNRKVLAARLADARFFYETDLKTPLEAQAAKLDRIVFHKELGTVADKVDRVAKLARWLVEEGIVGAKGSRPFDATVTPAPLVTPAKAGVSGRVSKPTPNETPASAGVTDSGATDDARARLAALAERAARLCKADLVTGMVGEFPELQGVMGGYYAAAQGLEPEVAAAIRDHYKPVGQGDEVPTAPMTVAVSLADKLDTIIGFFGVGEAPTGSRDPFALRRAALAVIALITANHVRLRLDLLMAISAPSFVTPYVTAVAGKLARVDADTLVRVGNNPHVLMSSDYQAKLVGHPAIYNFAKGFAEVGQPILDFFADRLKVQQREAGVRHDLIDAVFALGGEDDLVRLLARVRALQAFVGTQDGANLLAGYKRAANILKKEGWSGPGQPQLVAPAEAGAFSGVDAPGGEIPASAGMTNEPQEPAQTALVAALDAAEPAAAAAVGREDFEGAMAALAALRAPIDRFFDEVTVNAPDPAIRAGRLDLLARVRDAVHRVADFSRIEG